jgi:exosortase
MNWKQATSPLSHILINSLRSNHGRIILFGLLIGLCYFPTWLMSAGLLAGSSNFFIGLSFAYLGLDKLWQNRKTLVTLCASEEERLVGHLLILGGASCFPFVLSSVSLQAITWISILVGIAYSHWGLKFFATHRSAIILLLISAWPALPILVYPVWETLTPNHFLENWTAETGSWALQLIGQPAITQESFIVLPAGTIQIQTACTALNMGTTIAAFSLILGIFFKQSAKKITGLTLIAIALAVIFNIPRIVLLSMAAVYWGEAAFDFWHESWGAQIFVWLLMTTYYYVFMGVINYRPKASR